MSPNSFRPIVKVVASTLLFLPLLLLGACGGGGSGDTDGGQGSNSAGAGTQFVSNGGAGGTISFFEVPDELSVGETGHFVVELRDPRGVPLDNVQIACDSELGIAIIEPSTAREHTNVNGRMSGLVGGLTAGSYLFECRAEEGFNLAVRKSIAVTGTAPDGFSGFPGAAGGTMGGGSVVVNPGQVTITTISFQQNGDDATTLDTSRNPSCPGGDPEAYTNPTFTITVSNGTTQTLTILSVDVRVAASPSTATFTLPQGEDIAAGTSASIVDTFWTTPVDGSDGPRGVATYPDGNKAIGPVQSVQFTVNGRFANGEEFETTRTTSIAIQNLDGCSDS